MRKSRKSLTPPGSLLEAIRFFEDPDVCLSFMAQLRWPDGTVVCPRCGSTEVGFLSTRRLWECKSKHERRQFSIKVGTIFEDSPIALDKWLAAVWLIANAKNGISSYELGRSLKVSQKSAWFMLHRIRLAMQAGSFEKLSGGVEADETYIGGKARNMHKDRLAKGGARKELVVGLLDRETRKVRLRHVPDRTGFMLQGHIKDNVASGTDVFTDELASYTGLDREYVHNVINHAETYVEGNMHTNGSENFWSLLKRAIRGTYVSVEPFHLFRYLDEQAFRFNERKDDDGGRFLAVLRSIVGKRLTYKELTGANLAPSPA